jgi:hypothetical protein
MADNLIVCQATTPLTTGGHQENILWAIFVVLAVIVDIPVE